MEGGKEFADAFIDEGYHVAVVVEGEGSDGPHRSVWMCWPVAFGEGGSGMERGNVFLQDIRST